MAGAHAFKIFLPVQDHFHGAFRRLAHLYDQRLDVGLHLVAKATANTRGQTAQLAHGHFQAFTDIRLYPEDGLIGGPQGHTSLFVDIRQRAAGFYCQMRLRGSFIGAFNDQVRLRKACLQIAFV